MNVKREQNGVPIVIKLREQTERLLSVWRRSAGPIEPKPSTRPIHPTLTTLIFILITLFAYMFLLLEHFIFELPRLQRVYPINLPLNIVMVSLLGAFFLFYIAIGRFRGLVNFNLLCQTVFLCILIWINIRTNTDFRIMTFPLTIFASFLLPLPNALVWVVLYFLITAAATMYEYGFETGLGDSASLGAFAIFVFIGYLTRRSNQAYYTIEAINTDLQEGNMQLRDYSKNVRQLAISEERNRMAREMHDSLGHSLTVAVVQLEGAEKLIPKDPQRAAGIISKMREQLKAALGELRQTLSTLREDEIEDEETGNLAMALTELKQNFAAATGLEIDLQLPDNMPDMSQDERHTFYRVAQEGLTNIQRHAQATHAILTLSANRHETVLQIEDNGRGLPETVQDGRFGLRGLAERAKVHSGSFEMGNRPDGGAELRFAIPKIKEKG